MAKFVRRDALRSGLGLDTVVSDLDCQQHCEILRNEEQVRIRPAISILIHFHTTAHLVQ